MQISCILRDDKVAYMSAILVHRCLTGGGKTTVLVVSIISYFNHPVVHDAMADILKTIRQELELGERVHLLTTGRTVRLVASFNEYMGSQYTRIEIGMLEFVAE